MRSYTTGGRVAKGADGQDMGVQALGHGRTGLDVLGPGGEYIFVGGPAKAANVSKFGTQLKNARAAADRVGAYATWWPRSPGMGPRTSSG